MVEDVDEAGNGTAVNQFLLVEGVDDALVKPSWACAVSRQGLARSIIVTTLSGIPRQ